MLEDFLAVLGGAGLLDAGNNSFNLLVGDKAALYTGRLALTERRIQHIAAADEVFRASIIENRARVDGGGGLERDASGNIGLN